MGAGVPERKLSAARQFLFASDIMRAGRNVFKHALGGIALRQNRIVLQE